MSDTTVKGSDSAVAQRKDFPALKEMVVSLYEETGGENGDVVPTEDFVLSVMDQILSAETEDDIFELQEAGTTAGKDFTNIPFFLRAEDVTFQRAQQVYIDAGGFPYFARMTVTEAATGEQQVISTGAKTLVAAIYSLRRLGALDGTRNDGKGKALVIKDHPSANGAWLSIAPFVMPTAGKSRAKASA